MAELTKRVMVRLSPEVYEKLTKVARRKRRYPSTFARILIEDALGDDADAEIPGANGHEAT